ncbi:CvpA family protein [Chitinimonas sp. BJB300]|uniref:CvpA family protein n=1 Tax=Chitinimonas sp. BJB300 TaxID=1559339 RepID=UPI000C110D39|nr:CvpA family protein [Chitinimonas sp. BJB300]PHV13321.1 colicin V production protein [Chitinimonas sp. BJB300]TSJ85973.1 CvpA family protein [Chitinimonas sp. BJB300]
MTGFDYAVLIILGLSVLLAVLRGGISEILSLSAWILGFWLAQQYAAELGARLPPEVPTVELRLIAGFLGILLGVWFLSAIVRITLAQFIKASGLATWDRLLGAVFGVIRGALIVLALVMVAGLTSVPKMPIWRDAMFSPPLEASAIALKPWLPPELANHIKFE